jgi:hypothetical protein
MCVLLTRSVRRPGRFKDELERLFARINEENAENLCNTSVALLPLLIIFIAPALSLVRRRQSAKVDLQSAECQLKELLKKHTINENDLPAWELQEQAEAVAFEQHTSAPRGLEWICVKNADIRCLRRIVRRPNSARGQHYNSSCRMSFASFFS